MLNESVNIVARKHPLTNERVNRTVVAGSTINEMIVEMGVSPFSSVRVEINGELVRREDFAHTMPRPGDLVTIRPIFQGGGGGGKNPLRTIMTLAVVATAAWAGPIVGAWAVEAGIAGSWEAYAIASAIGSGVVFAAGSLAVNALAPPSLPDMPALIGRNEGASNNYSVSGSRNLINQFGVVPCVLGTGRFAPFYGAEPYTEIRGDDQYLRLLFDFGFGPLDLSDFRIDETDLANFDGVETEIRYGYDTDVPLTRYTNDVHEEQLSIKLEAGSPQIRTTQADVEEISVDISFPQLVEFLNDGSKKARSVQFKVEYSVTGVGAWSTADTVTVTAKSTSTVRQNVTFSVAKNQYDVRLTRLTSAPNKSEIFDDTYWTVLRSIAITDPISVDYDNAKMVLIIKASDQLNGIVDKFNCLAQRICLDWNGSSWVEQATSNPASLFRYVLQGPANKRPLLDSHIDLTSLQGWHEYCTAQGFEFNHIVDYQSSVPAMLSNICAAGRATWTYIDGKYTVIWDESQSVPRQHFTPRNTWGFSSSKEFKESIHAWRIQFKNEDEDYQQDERIVYDDGYSSANATLYETLSIVGVTNPDSIWKHGRYHIATLRLRPERYTFNVDVENLVVTKGDLIRLNHDVLLVGLASARVKAVQDNGTHATGVTLDEIVTMEASKTYGLVFRLADGSELTATLTTVPGDSATVTFATPILLASAPQIGDLAAYGESGSETIDLIIKSIEPSPDFKAKVIAVDAALSIYDADTGAIPAYTSGITAQASLPDPVITEVVSDERAMLDAIFSTVTPRILITLYRESGKLSVIERVELEYRVTGSTEAWNRLQFPADATQLVIPGVEVGESYDIRVRYVNISDVSSWTYSLGHVVAGLSTQPVMPRVSGLEIFGQGNGTVFTGKHCKFEWTPAALSTSYDIGSEDFGADSGTLDAFFKDYEVRVYNGETLLRVEHVTDNWYTYIYEKNVEDGGPFRQFTVEVYMRGKQNQISPIPARITVSNPAPAQLTGVSVDAGFKSIYLSYNEPSDLDFEGVNVWLSESSGFTPSDSNLVYSGPDTDIFLTKLTDGTLLSPSTTYYVVIAGFDGFGQTGLNYSNEVSETTLLIIGGDIGDSAVSENKIATSAITNTKIADLAVGEAKIQSSSITNTKIADFAVIENKVATAAITNTKIADFAVTNAKIENAAITNAKIAALAVDEAKIADLAVTNAKINDLAVTNAKIAALAVDEAKIAALAVTNAKIAALAVDEAKIADLAVTNAKIADLAVDDAKIAALAVGEAKIADLAVTNAKIADLAVTNAKINDLSADKINVGTLSADRIAAGSLTADKISTTSLSAISANLGTITSGSLDINNKFIVDSSGNATIKSATSGARTEITNSVIKVYDSGGVLRVKLGDLS